jgi:hypothetical protein
MFVISSWSDPAYLVRGNLITLLQGYGWQQLEFSVPDCMRLYKPKAHNVGNCHCRVVYVGVLQTTVQPPLYLYLSILKGLKPPSFNHFYFN